MHSVILLQVFCNLPVRHLSLSFYLKAERCDSILLIPTIADMPTLTNLNFRESQEIVLPLTVSLLRP